MRPLALAAALVALLSAVAPGQEAPQVITIASPKTGEKVKVTLTETVETKITTYVLGKDDVKTEYKTKKFEYEDEITNGNVNSRLPASVKRKYELATIGTGKEKDKIDTEGHPIQGKLVIISNNGGPVYSFTVDKKIVNSGEIFELLKAEFGSGVADLRDHMITKKPLKEGETWEMKSGSGGPQAVVKELSKNSNDLILNEVGATINGKLIDIAKRTKEEKEKGKPIMGNFEVTFAAPVSHFGKDKGFSVEKDSTLTVKLTANGCIDGKLPDGTLTTVMTLNLKTMVDGLNVDIHVTATEVRKIEKK